MIATWSVLLDLHFCNERFDFMRLSPSCISALRALIYMCILIKFYAQSMLTSHEQSIKRVRVRFFIVIRIVRRAIETSLLETTQINLESKHILRFDVFPTDVQSSLSLPSRLVHTRPLDVIWLLLLFFSFLLLLILYFLPNSFSQYWEGKGENSQTERGRSRIRDNTLDSSWVIFFYTQ